MSRMPSYHHPQEENLLSEDMQKLVNPSIAQAIINKNFRFEHIVFFASCIEFDNSSSIFRLVYECQLSILSLRAWWSRGRIGFLLMFAVTVTGVLGLV
jgi:hypothetical protein